MRVPALAGLTLLLGALGAHSAPQLPPLWASPTGPSSQSGQSAGASGPNSIPRVQWTLDVAGGRGAAVAVAGDGTVFIAGGSSVVAAHGTSGATVWNVTLSGTVFPNTLVVTGSGQVRVWAGRGVSPLLHACFSQQAVTVPQHRLSSPRTTFDAHAYALA